MAIVGRPMDYASVAATYAKRRWPLSWKLTPLLDAISHLEGSSEVVDVGCGTGDYLLALHEKYPRHRYRGVDISPEMLGRARDRCPWARLDIGNADQDLLGEAGVAAVVFCIDVLHHLQDYRRFFTECARILRVEGILIVITDLDGDIHARTLGKLFPETIAINLQRYPRIHELLECSAHSDLDLVSQETVSGLLDFDDRVMSMLADRSLSELRLISDQAHRQGMRRARMAQLNGNKWLSQTTVLEWRRTRKARPGV
jgi:SAM-dependent methyltransferase